MARRLALILLALLLHPAPQSARQEATVCGTHREKRREELYLHRQAVRERARIRSQMLVAAPAAPVARDIGNIALIEDSDGVVARRNPFNLDQRSVAFNPTGGNASAYRFQTGAGTFDSQAANRGEKLEGLQDDDSRQISLPFSFPFYGAVYQQLFVNSDGNLTFLRPDTEISDRSLGRVTSGPPRIAPLFRDLDPSRSAQGVRVLREPSRLVVSWVEVPEYREFGTGPLQTFQARLYPSGRIEFDYAGISTANAVVGISPGGLQGQTAVVSFVEGSTLEFSGTLAERFGGTNEIDVVAAAQRFFATHEDSYDYLMIFNNLGISAGSSALAYEITVRNNRTGYGDAPVDNGREYGSASRLQAVTNMGSLSQYPADPNARVGTRGQITGDTPLTIMAHEAGHLFLAFASVRDHANPDSLPMLGAQYAHWSFFFNSDASLLEGNRIRDNGPSVSRRFITTATVQGFSRLDQYLMGLRAPEEVTPIDHDLFVVNNPGGSYRAPSSLPQVGISFDGDRRDIAVGEIIQAEGRRTPDHTVSQRRFRFAFILIVAKGTDPSQAEIDKIETFRQEFEKFYNKAAGGLAWADTTLKRSLKLSVFPAAGVIAGSSISASVTIEQPAAAPLAIELETQNGAASAPRTVVIPAGSTSAVFPVSGVRAGVEELVARPGDARYETAYARIQVLASRADLKLSLVSGDRQGVVPGARLAEPLVFRVTDINNLPYQGLPVTAAVTGGGAVTPAVATSGMDGLVRFIWTAGAGSEHRLTAAIEGAPGSSVAVELALAPSFPANGVVNAASFAAGLSPGGFASIFGSGLATGSGVAAVPPFPLDLAGVRVWLSGRPLPLHFVSPGQINFLVPLDVLPGDYDLRVSNAVGTSASVRVTVLTASPGVFFDPRSGFGAILVAGTGQTVAQRAAAAGEFLEIYATGLGAVQPHPTFPGLQETVLKPKVLLGGSLTLPVSFSGLNPVYPGLYQVNALIPAGAPVGEQTLLIEIGGVRSNTVQIRLR